MRLSTHGDEAGLPYTPPDRLIADFVSRGMVLLSPDDVGVAPEVHQRIYEAEKAAMAQRQSLKPADVPEMLEVLDAPGLVAACDRLVGPNWAIVPSMHCSSFVRGGRNQHWHKDDNGPYNSRKQRHHQAVQLELLYYPQPVGAMMGPTATIPYSQYWALNHEENHDNFAGADHLDFEYHIGGMEREDISGPDSPYSREQIAEAQTPHDLRTREAVKNTGWPLVTEFEAAPLRAGSVIIYSHNLYHRGNHRRDDWHTWEDNPRFMWRFWLYRTTDPPTVTATVVANGWSRDADPLTGTDLSVAGTNVIAVWDYHYHWIQTGRRPAACRLAAADEDGCSDADARADRLLQQLHTTGEAAEPQRVGAILFYRGCHKWGRQGISFLSARHNCYIPTTGLYGRCSLPVASVELLLRHCFLPLPVVLIFGKCQRFGVPLVQPVNDFVPCPHHRGGDLAALLAVQHHSDHSRVVAGCRYSLGLLRCRVCRADGDYRWWLYLFHDTDFRMAAAIPAADE